MGAVAAWGVAGFEKNAACTEDRVMMLDKGLGRAEVRLRVRKETVGLGASTAAIRAEETAWELRRRPGDIA